MVLNGVDRQDNFLHFMSLIWEDILTAKTLLQLNKQGFQVRALLQPRSTQVQVNDLGSIPVLKATYRISRQ